MLTLNCFSKIFQSVDEFVEMQMLRPFPILDKVFTPSVLYSHPIFISLYIITLN